MLFTVLEKTDTQITGGILLQRSERCYHRWHSKK